jgi:hypothetical protein
MNEYLDQFSTRLYKIEIGTDSVGDGEVMYNVVNQITGVIEGRFQPLPMCVKYINELQAMADKFTPELSASMQVDDLLSRIASPDDHH